MIEFKTQLDINSQRVLNKFMMKKLIIFSVVFSLFLIAIGVVGAVFTEEKTAGIVLIIIGVILTPLMLILNAIGQKNMSKTAPILNNVTKEIYRFTEEGFEHLQKRGESFQSHTKADYTYFYKVISTPTHYLMYISDRQCHVIDKSHITQGACQELDELLIRKLPAGKFKTTK